jgi:hypothetical protein
MRIGADISASFHRIQRDWIKEIEQARLTPGFEREYNLQYGFGIGNVFLPDQIENALELSVKLGIDIDIDN